MLSRVAENLYWTGRYLERAENTARLINVNAHLLLDLPRLTTPRWEPLIDIMGDRDLFRERHAEFDERSVVRYLVGDTNYPSSILACLAAARENARTMRDTIPREAWEFVNELYLFAKDDLSSGLSKRGRFEYLDRVIKGSQTLTGMLLGTMSHDAGFFFMRTGRSLERADMTTRIIDVRSANLLGEETSGVRPYENIQWMSVLKSLTGYQMYRQKVQVRVRREPVLRFLLLDAEFPRSVLHCISYADESIRALPRAKTVRRSLARMKRVVQGADMATLAASSEALHEFVDQLQVGLSQVHNDIALSWFSLESNALAISAEAG